MLELKKQLSGVFTASGVSLERQFRGFDTDGDGAIDHDEFKNGLMSLGANVSEAQIDDLITILDKDGDGEIDYREFSLWFGAGPPPPPVLPQVKSMQDARSNSAVDSNALLREIQAKAKSRRPPPPVRLHLTRTRARRRRQCRPILEKGNAWGVETPNLFALQPTPEMVARIEARSQAQIGSGSPEQRHLSGLREHAKARAEKRSRTLMLRCAHQYVCKSQSCMV